MADTFIGDALWSSSCAEMRLSLLVKHAWPPLVPRLCLLSERCLDSKTQPFLKPQFLYVESSNNSVKQFGRCINGCYTPHTLDHNNNDTSTNMTARSTKNRLQGNRIDILKMHPDSQPFVRYAFGFLGSSEALFPSVWHINLSFCREMLSIALFGLSLH